MKMNQNDEKCLKSGFWIEDINRNGHSYGQGLYKNGEKQGVWLYVYDMPDDSIDIIESNYDNGVNLGIETYKSVIPSEETEYIRVISFIDFNTYEGENLDFVYR